MNVVAVNGSARSREREGWRLAGLSPTPEEEWDRLLDFVNLTPEEMEAMLTTVETLFRRGPELVASNYEYLQQHHETAAILGWDGGADPVHLAERRRFFTVWLARALGMDMGHDFARYLFRAGQIHAGHGPRQIHVPERYVTGAISLVNATFARYLSEETPANPHTPMALAGWNKMLSLHLHMMLLGYQAARHWDQGEFPLKLSLFGRMRRLARQPILQMGVDEGTRVETVLKKFFNYYPQARPEVCDIDWLEGERVDEQGRPWLTVEKSYRVKPGWRLLLNGRDLAYHGGLEREVQPGDDVSIFPPGR